jgi:hypothetical protein
MSLECPHKVNEGESLPGELRFSLILSCHTIRKVVCMFCISSLFFFCHIKISQTMVLPLQNGEYPSKDLVKSGYEIQII